MVQKTISRIDTARSTWSSMNDSLLRAEHIFFINTFCNQSLKNVIELIKIIEVQTVFLYSKKGVITITVNK